MAIVHNPKEIAPMIFGDEIALEDLVEEVGVAAKLKAISGKISQGLENATQMAGEPIQPVARTWPWATPSLGLKRHFRKM